MVRRAVRTDGHPTFPKISCSSPSPPCRLSSALEGNATATMGRDARQHQSASGFGVERVAGTQRARTPGATALPAASENTSTRSDIMNKASGAVTVVSGGGGDDGGAGDPSRRNRRLVEEDVIEARLNTFSLACVVKDWG